MTKIKETLTTAYHRWHLGRWAAGLFGLLVLLMVLTWALLPGLVKRIAAEQVQAQIGRKLEMDDIRFSPFKLALTIDGLSLYEADQRTAAVKVKQLVLNLSMASLFRQALIVDEVKISEPYLHIVRLSAEGQGRYNFTDVLDKIAAMPKSDSQARFSLANLQLEGGKIEIDDKVVNEQFKIEALQIGVPFASNFPNQVDSFVEPMLSAKVNGSPFSMKGRAKPFTNTLDTSLAIDFDKLDLTQYLPYLPLALPVNIKRAKLSTRLDLIFSRKNAHPELLLAGDVHLDEVAVNDKADAALFKLASLHTQIKQINIMTAAASLSKLELTAPELWVDIDQQGQINWVKALASAEDKKPVAKPAAKAAGSNKVSKAKSDTSASAAAVTAAKPATPLLQLAELQISKGQFHLRDAKHAAPAQAVHLQDISLKAQHLSSAADAKPAVFQFALSGEHEEKLKFEGEAQPLQASMKGQLALNAWSIASYQAFLTPFLTSSVSGQVDMATQLQIEKGIVQLDDLNFKLSQFAIKGKSADDGNLGLKSLVVDKLQLNTNSRQINIGSVLFDGLTGDIRRDEQAVLNINKWLRNQDATKKTEAASTVANTAASTASNVATSLPPTAVAAPASAWKVNLASLDFKAAAVSFNDKAMQPEVSLKFDGLNLHAEKLSSDLSQAIKLSLQTNIGRKAKLSLDATAGSQLKTISLNLDGQALPVSALFPYVSPYVNAALTRGRADIKGKLNLNNILDSKRQINYEGMLALTDFHLLENGAEEDFLEWKSIAMDGISAQIGGDKQLVTLKKLALNDFYARAILSAKGKLNIQSILSTKKADAEDAAEAKDAAAKPESSADAVKAVTTKTATSNIVTVPLPAKPEKSNPVVVRIAQTTLSGGNINFTDNFVKPNYTANLTGVTGTIGAIASDNPQPATIELTGKVDDDAPLVISGSLNPLSNPVFMDVKASANGLELTRLTPYAAKYAGYVIEKGKLSMQVSYRIENQQLQAENDVRLDQLTFGERVESPSATKLPVMLAVALLRDNQGRISINLPITGSLSDPQFSVGGIIFKVFVNIITKAVTSPFALLGSMFGGGEELAYTEFLPGQTSLTPAATEKLDNLAKALKNRSGLKLDIIGRVDTATDTDGIRQLLLLQKMRELKWKDVHQKDRTVKKDDISISETEKAKYVEEVYQAEKFTKPRNAIGMAKTLPTAEAEKMILANTTVTADALRALAQKRADTVRDYLEDVAGIERERLFLIAPRLNADGIKDKGSPNRVDFSLK